MRARVARFTAIFQALLLMATLVVPALAVATEISTDLWIYQYGDTVTVTGIDFGADEDVSVVTTDPYGAGVDSGVAHTDASGGFTYSFTLLSDIPGIYDVVATGQASGLSAATQFDPPASITITFPAATVYTAATFNAGCSTAGGDLCGTALAGAGNLTKVEFSLQEGLTGNYWNGTDFTSASLQKVTLFTGSTTLAVNWSITPFPVTNFPSDGAYTLTIYTTQSSSPNANTLARAFAIDRTAAGAPARPTLVNSTPASPSANNNPSINGTAENGTTVRLYKQNDCGGGLQGTGYSNGSFSIPVSVGANSSTTFYGTATDASGNVSPCSTTSVTYVSDSNAPSVALNSTPTNPTTSTDADFTFTATDTGASASGVASVECRLDSPTWVACTSSTSFSQSGLLAGSHTFGVRATDNAGNVGGETTFTWTVNVSNTAPTVVVTGVSDGGSYAKGSVPAAGCAVTDTEDGNSTFAATLSAITGPDAANGIGSQTASCSYTDAGGLNDADSVTYSITDDTAPTIGYVITPVTPDGANGWYLGPVTLDWTVTEGDSSSTLVLTGCDDQSLTADQAEVEYTCSATSDGGSAGPVSVKIQIDGTKPTATVAVDDTPNGAGWFNSTVSFTTSGTDNLSGIASCTDAADYSGPDGDPVNSASATCTDYAGNVSDPDVSDPFKFDATKPTASVAIDDTPNGAGWFNSTVSFTTDGSDATSGIASCTDAADYSGPDSATAVSGSATCTDNAGNVSTPATSASFKYDATAPTASVAIDDVPNAAGWFKTTVHFTTSGTDNLSAIASCTDAADYSGPDSATAVSGSATCTDNAGNVSTPATSASFKYDATAPVLNVSGAAAGAYDVCGIPGRPSFAPTDALSGIDSTLTGDSWVTPGTPSGVGAYNYAAWATDLAGNYVSDNRTFSVTYGSAAFSGYLQPINNDGSSRFKLGSTVPVKFQMKCGSTFISVAVAKLYVVKGDNQPDPGVDEAISTSAATTGNLFRYDASAQQYIFNLSTKLGYTNPGSTTPIQFTQGSWTLKIGLDDGTFRSVNIQLVK